jgi:MSHA type pilus biogenesis protein MshL
MKSIQQIFQYSGIMLLLLVFSSCSSQPPQKVEETHLSTAGSASVPPPKAQSLDSKTLPVEYQKPSYIIGTEQTKDDKDLAHSDVIVKVGASIHSTVGPQPLRDIMKRLAVLKGMNISWSSDVDQNALVDVDINANDDFNEAISHLLRQINYFHETKGNTLVIKNKETRQFRIGMPFISQTYSTDTGGDVLGGNKDTQSFKGKINLTASGSPVGTNVGSTKDDSTKTQFDIWANIEGNLKVILDILETSETTVTSKEREFGGTGQSANPIEAIPVRNASGVLNPTPPAKAGETTGKTVKTSRQTSKTGAYFTIDKPVGIITVTATRDLLEKVDDYLTSLKKELYKQINIEAKMIEVQLINQSNMGLDWTKLLRTSTDTSGTQLTAAVSGLSSQESIKTLTLTVPSFSVLINALKEEGDTKVLSNPKISVMNGEPAFITVGRNTAYISKVTSTHNATDNSNTFTIDTSSVLSGVGLAISANIADNNEVIMNLVPVVSRLKNDRIENVTIGTGVSSALVGLPIVDVREMSTTVRVKNGQMLVIGGLIDNTNQNDDNHIPLLGDVPLLKYVFGNESKSTQKKELIILLKPTIL